GLDLIDDRILVDLSAGFDLRPGVSLFGTVSNVFNVAYNASFSPDGARPGAPRMAMGGVKLRF
ncbi:TonB-dependent receptor, partial [Polymorphobacter multimanifer]